MAENRARSLIEKYSIDTSPIQKEESPIKLGEIITSKPESRSKSLIDKYSQTTITDTISQNPTFKDDFVNDMDPSTPEEVNNKYAYAFKLGLADTFRGIKQIAGKDKEEMKAEQKNLMN